MSLRIGQTASSSFPGSKFDVFLSFRREDTGYTFTDHLYWALVKKGIHIFRDDEELERGEMIHQTLLKGIEESRIFIIIFSKNYADSKWCLNELVKIMECTRAWGRKVFPIFYHVDPSEVREQSGNYGKAFADYENDAKLEREQIQKWRTALTEACNLPGYRVENQYESTIIMQITNLVIARLEHVYFGDDNLVGIDNRLKELKLLLGVGFNDVRMLGVYGLGGIGKTTVVKVIYNSFLYQFDGVSFLQNVREQSLLQLQEKLLIDITGVKDKNLNDVVEGVNEIKKRLRQKKVLIIVDDVDYLNQLECLVPDRDCFGRGSRIIITTRDKHLLCVYGVDAIYEVQGLNFEESMLLFSQCAFKKRFPEERYAELSKHVVCHAHGHPLTLKVLGHSLYGKTISDWKVELDKLKRQPTHRILNVLLISFDRLDHTTKNIFLDIACFLNGEERESVSRILDGAEQAITTLYNRSLLTFSNNKILMHPLLQQMGQLLVRQEYPAEPGKWSRLWTSEDIHLVLTKNEGTNAIEGIFLNMSTSKPIEFTTDAFKMMNRLRLIKVHRDLKCGSIVKTCEVHVSTDFEFPSYELRYLHWDGYPLESLPSNFQGDNLIVLNLQYSNVKELWKGSKILEKLKVINLSHSQQLIQIPDFSDTPNLESLILEGCTDLEKLPSSIWELDSLVNLDLSHCSKLQKLPEIEWNLYSLEYLNLASCQKLESLPEGLCNLKCLRTLNVIGCSKLDRLPKSLGSLDCLEKLCASNAELIGPQLDSSLAGLCSLKILDVHGTYLSEGAISSDIGSLYSLEELDLSYCNLTGGIPDEICCLCSLRVLDLSGNHFLRVTDATSKISKLRVLRLRHCKNLEKIPELPSSLGVLDAHGCTSMGILSRTSLPPWQRLFNCFKSAVLLEIQELKYRRLLSVPETSVNNGFSTVIPGSGEVPEWISQQSIGSEVTVELPLNWYNNNGFLGFALCCVYISQQDEPKISMFEEESDQEKSDLEESDQEKSDQEESDHEESDQDESHQEEFNREESDQESKNAMMDITQPYRLHCELTFLDDEIGFTDSLSFGSSCQCDHNDGVSDSVWITSYLNDAIKQKYGSHKSRHLKASFHGYVDGKPVKVEKCGIGLVHVDL